jgi:hypothetical protein
MRYLLIAVSAGTMLTTSALAFSGKSDSGKGLRAYEGRGYLAYDAGGGHTARRPSNGYAPVYSAPRPRTVLFQERCSFTNDPSC